MQSSSTIGRLLIAATTMLLPLDDHLPAIGGRSLLFILFAVLAVWVALQGLTHLRRVLAHRIVIAVCAYLILGFALESLHRTPHYFDLLHTALMLFGAIVLASLCSDRAAIQTLCYSLAAGGVILSFLLFQSMYSLVDAAGAGREAAQAARTAIDANRTVEGDLNALSCYAAIAAAMSLHLALARGSLLLRGACLAAFGFCTVGTFLPLSRSGVLVLTASLLAVIHGHGGIRPRNVAALVLFAIVLTALVPNGAFGRLDVSETDGRSTIYNAVLANFSEYVLDGVGAGQYWNGWAISHGIASGDGAMGAHNAFLQTLVYWGFLGLLALFAVIFAAARSMPKVIVGDDVAVAARLLAFAALCWLLVVHTMWDKQFSLVLAVLVAVDLQARSEQKEFLAVPTGRLIPATWTRAYPQ